MVWIGRTVMPFDFMSMRMKEMPVCFLAEGSVRHKLKIMSACWASVVQVFWPLTMYLSPLRSALVFNDARSEPEPGSENPWHHQSSTLAIRGRYCFFCSSLPKV